MDITSRTARADQLQAELRDATPGRGHLGCDAFELCDECRPKLDEVRAVRREEIIHQLATVRPRLPID